jgi:hypothetical protein
MPPNGKPPHFTKPRARFDWIGPLIARVALAALAFWSAVDAANPAAATTGEFVVAQATVPPTGMGSEDKAMAAQKMPEAARMRRRFPQPVSVGSLIGLPVIDENARTLGYIREAARTRQGGVELIVSTGGWFGWGARLIAVPIEVLGIAGRQLVSLDMAPGDYATAPTWPRSDEQVIPDADTISVALARR